MVNDSAVKGKRLLVLGGTYSTLDVVQTAKKMGIHTIVTDYLPHGDAKDCADEQAMISTTDFEELGTLIKEKHIDGVFTGASEFNIKNMIKLCHMNDLPVYADEKQWGILSNKKRFKDLCVVNGIDVVKEYSFENRSSIEYPVIVKPVDSYSGHGISICHNEEELITAYDYAMSNSSSKSVIIEQFETGDNVELYGLIQDGRVFLTTASDRFTDKNQNGSPVPTFFFHQSKHIKEYLDNVHPKVEKMFRSIGIKYGVFFIESFYRDRKFRFYEMGFRLNATQEYHFVDYFNGFNPLELMIRYAVSGSMGPSVEQRNIPFARPACEMVILLKEGKIAKIEGIEKIRELPSVIHVIQFMKEGSIVDGTGTLDQTFARIQLVATNEGDLISQIKNIYSILHIYDESADDMIVKVNI